MRPNILAILIILSIIILFGFIIVFISFSIIVKYKSNTYTGYYSTLANSSFMRPLIKLIDNSILNKESNEFATNTTAQCGKAFHASNIKLNRIIFGSTAEPHSYPWTASLRIMKNKTLYDHFCGAVLISQNSILTAAHCVVNRSVESLVVVLGLHYRNDVSEYSTKNSYRVSEMKINLNYNSTTSENDIALLKLSRKVQINENITFICLPSENSNVKYSNKNALITGWGLSNNTNNTQLQQTLISIIDNNDKICKSYLNKANKESILCAINSEYHSNACSGDSGGPLAIYENQKWILIGIVSFVLAKPNNYLNSSIECDPNAPSFYSKISFHLEWILKNI